MKTSLRFCLVALSWLLLAGAARAQGTAFTYQGRLNSGPTNLTGLYDFTFALFNASSAGAQAGSTLNSTATPVTNGLFTATLDFGAQFPGAGRWLEITVRTNGGGAFTTLAPRQRITATPYAITASNITGLVPAASLAGTYSSAVTLNNAGNSFTGNGAGLTSLNANNLASGTVPDARLAPNIARTNQVWQTAGNLGTTPGTDFLGTRDNQAVEIKVNNTRALRLEPNANGAPNVIGGSPYNTVAAGVVGATIGGGGATTYFGSPLTNRVAGDFGVIGGGYENSIGAQTRSATVSGGRHNSIGTNSHDAAIGGGTGNAIGDNAFQTTIAGGTGNRNFSFASAIGGGYVNALETGTDYSVIGGGVENVVQTNAFSSTIAGGEQNQISTGLFRSTIGGGGQNTNTGSYAAVPGGDRNVAAEFAFAAGRRAKAGHRGAFVWADATDADLITTAQNQFLIRAGGGVGLGATNLTGALFIRQPEGLPANGMAAADNGLALGQFRTNSYKWIQSYGGALILNPLGNNVGIGLTNPSSALHVNGTVTAIAFNPPSDRNLKENFTGVSPREVLEKVSALKITRWNFKGDAATPHLGPMAQDFHAAFQLGTDDRHIATVDADGVALAAIQGLNQKVESEKQKAEKEREQLRAENTELKARLEKLEQLLIEKAGGAR